MEFKDLSEKEQNLAIANKYDLLRDKAIILQEKGIEVCRHDNNFNFKDIIITKDAINLIKKGLPQIINYKGLSFERPLEGLTIRGFYFLLHLFYFKRSRQIAHFFDNYTIDHILIKNTITGDEMWLTNKVSKITDEEIEIFKKK